jgi:hypothetical protein
MNTMTGADLRTIVEKHSRALLRGSSALVARGVVQREGKASSMLVRWVKVLE